MSSIPHPARPRTTFPLYTTDPVDLLIQVTQSLLTLAHLTYGLDDDHALSADIGDMACMLAEALDRVYNGVMDERDRCTCGYRTVMEG